ncbi:MAG TPA: asparagine synthase (glutamine-hydrolyzing) [Bacteroidales bacterium]|nr:asparagine synthase (glutamine-hydrolyzing) [Bacteroidales bacterium]
MCGICGHFSFDKPISIEALKGMTDALQHRGPDATGHFSEKAVSLGHIRLSIIDLSTHANQPMFSHNKRYVIVFNGEIYNYNEIAKQLGIEQKTTSDTEVILEALAKKGTESINLFNGMYAIALYDREEETLTLIRDRVGIKPLFYFWDGSHFAFASELKALLKLEIVKQNLKINHKAVNDYLHLGFIPEPQTIYENIYKFPASSYGVLKENHFNIEKYWSISEQINAQTISHEKEAKEKLKELITSSVKYRLISDVPYGVFLSGGIDSSLVAATAQNITGNIKTFSIGFKEARYNEAPYAKAIAEYLKTKHTEFTVTYNDAISLIQDIVPQYDEPFADASAVPTMMVSRLAKNDVSMVLSGDGGDELFWGYGAYHWAKRLSNPLLKNLRYPIASCLNMGNSRQKRIAQMLRFDKHDFLPAHILSQEQYFFRTKEVSSLLNHDYLSSASFHEPKVEQRKINSIEKQSLFDFCHYLKDDLLVKVDRASMKYALEVRVPLLDYRITEFAFNLSPELKHKNHCDKYLLKQMLYDYVPESYFNRPKWGFALPLNHWLKNELKPLVHEYLNLERLKQQAMLDVNQVEKILTRYKTGDDYLYGRIWNLLMLEMWLKKNAKVI